MTLAPMRMIMQFVILRMKKKIDSFVKLQNRLRLHLKHVKLAWNS